MVNLSAFIRFHARRAPDREALIYAGQRITYRDFLDRILRMARMRSGESDRSRWWS
jgi:fatty-acyl-CoA synthase